MTILMMMRIQLLRTQRQVNATQDHHRCLRRLHPVPGRHGPALVAPTSRRLAVGFEVVSIKPGNNRLYRVLVFIKEIPLIYEYVYI